MEQRVTKMRRHDRSDVKKTHTNTQPKFYRTGERDGTGGALDAPPLFLSFKNLGKGEENKKKHDPTV